MKLVVFGLTISSSWGNGHATIWRGLCRGLNALGHQVVFFERDVPYYAGHRDLAEIPGGKLVLYSEWQDAIGSAQQELREADAAIVTSYCPDGIAATDLVLDSTAPAKVFYDLDTPVTLGELTQNRELTYIGPRGLAEFDLVLSFTGGTALDALRRCLGARRTAPLYGSVDPDVHHLARPQDHYRADLSYLGTYAGDRQAILDELLLEPARRLPERRFLMAGAQYPHSFPWTENLFFVRHLPPDEHAAFFSSSRVTLNVTRQAMAEMGYCPSGRLFEAMACGAPVLSDWWEGLDEFYRPDEEILIARSTEQAVAVIELSDLELRRIAQAGRERTLDQYTADRRAAELESLLASVMHHSDRRAPTTESIPALRSSQAPAGGWGIIPAAGAGSRIQPLAFSKELLPVGSQIDGNTERPRAISEYLVERMIRGGADKLAFVISPGKSDILEYYSGRVGEADIAYVVQPKPAGLCDAIFRPLPLIGPLETVLVGLPDTVWFPEDGYAMLPDGVLSFLLFPVERPEFFDAVITDADDRVQEIQVKQREPGSNWIWGAFKMTGQILADLHRLWREREERDEYFGTLVNAWLAEGNEAVAVRAGTNYVDVGTLYGYRQAINLLSLRIADSQQAVVY
jgi:spore maturation protein CgeB/dTDP-glucose pyrophosphorylase